MHGAMYVVADLEEYQANPEAYLTKNPPQIDDALLKFNRPRTEWKLADLEPAAKTLTGRSYANGKQMFQIGACISCHKMAGQGQEFGPDLTKLDPKWDNVEVLKHILDPSLKIDDKYRSYSFQMDSGKVVTGMILEETPTEVKVIENPLAVGAKPAVLTKTKISERVKSPTSLMPKGLLDKMTRDEILDLLAYVMAKGEAKDKAFAGGDHKHGH
jgi:putative heme-binding domain-containing protein